MSQAQTQSRPTAPFWLVGFRPFFSLAMLYGALLAPLWILIFFGVIPAPHSGLSVLQWHSHEMFYGFGMAVLAGFLLTATKNWAGVRGYQGKALMVPVAFWILERLVINFAPPNLPPIGYWIFSMAFMISLTAMISYTLISKKNRVNYVFVAILALFVVAKALMLMPAHYIIGRDLTVGLFRWVLVLMLGRTVPMFARVALGVEVRTTALLERAITWLIPISAFAELLPAELGLVKAIIYLAAFAVLTWRFVLVRPLEARKKIELGVIYWGYGFLCLHYALLVLKSAELVTFVSDIPTHAFTLGGLGAIIAGMISRIGRGHTGRPISYSLIEKIACWLVILAGVFRVFVAWALPQFYIHALVCSAILWSLGFALFAWRLIPFLLAPRIDGREH